MAAWDWRRRAGQAGGKFVKVRGGEGVAAWACERDDDRHL